LSFKEKNKPTRNKKMPTKVNPTNAMDAILSNRTLPFPVVKLETINNKRITPNSPKK
jgi:hypothetical protein